MSGRPILYVGEKNVSSWSMRAWVALVHKGIDFEERTISLAGDRDRSERRKVSPTGRVPVLHHGSLVIPDSLAILEYVEEAYAPPGWPSLWPADRNERARARALAATMHSGFAELRDSMSFNLCFVAHPPHPTPKALAESRDMLASFETALAREPAGGPFLFGAFGGADVFYAPAVVRLTSFGVPTADFPRARDYMPAVLDEPAVKAWLDAARSLPPVTRY